ncbi:MAG: 4-hydroxy-3-methylbut-2-enyl diphosphate reductase [Planctomycetota bacterium]
MRVRLAETAGFCMGVRRAMGRVLDAASKPGGRLVTYGPLIHNSQVTQLLEDRGVAVVRSPEEILPGDRVAIRAHGVAPGTREAIRGKGAAILDATCPHVARAQGLVKRSALSGRDVIIVGDRGHAEVVGLLGFARGRGHVVERVEDVDLLPPLGPVAVVAQTTQSEELFRAVERRVRERFPDCESHATICGSTSDRQREVLQLAREVDVMIVVGGRHSANTVRLAEIVREAGKPVFHVEGAEELREEDFRQHSTAGVTAGASTPNWVIEEVIARLESFHTARTLPVVRSALDLFQILVRSGVIVAVGAAGLAFAAAEMLGRDVRLRHLAIPFAYVVSMLNWNVSAEVRSGEMGDRTRAALFRRYGHLFTALSLAFAAAAAVLSASLGLAALCVLLVSAVAGLFYTVPLFSRRLLGRYRRLKDLPGSRNIFFAGAVAVVTVLLPLLDRGSAAPPLAGVWIPVVFVAVLAFSRSVALDLKDLQSDIFAGRDTIPVVLGDRGTKVLLGALLSFAAVSVVAGAALGWIQARSAAQLLALGAVSGFFFFYHLRRIGFGVVFRALLDLTFLVPAAAAGLGRLLL